VTTVDDLAAPPSDFAGYYATRYPRLAAQLYAYLGDATEAEDLAQDAYLRAWRSWSKISEYDDLVGWVRWRLLRPRRRSQGPAQLHRGA
jgi:RNA polymerase sigma-70 factor, ECF subfamily